MKKDKEMMTPKFVSKEMTTILNKLMYTVPDELLFMDLLYMSCELSVLLDIGENEDVSVEFKLDSEIDAFTDKVVLFVQSSDFDGLCELIKEELISKEMYEVLIELTEKKVL